MRSKKCWKVCAVALAVVSCSGVTRADDKVFLHVVREGFGLSNTPANAEIITREDVERSAATNVGELIPQLLPSADAANAAGTLGGQKSLRLRFGPAAQTLILRDGVPLNGFGAEVWNLANMAMDTVERVEILHGASAALFGANAAAGVVNIVTRSPGERPALELRLGYGSFETPSFCVGFENRWDAVGVRGDVGYRTSSGWRENAAYTSVDAAVKAVGASDAGILRRVTVAFNSHVSDTGVPGPAPIPYYQWDGERERAASSVRARQRDENTAVDLSMDHALGTLRVGYADDALHYEDPDWFTQTRSRNRRLTLGGEADVPGTGITFTLDAQHALFLQEDLSAFPVDPVDRSLGNVGIGVRWDYATGDLRVLPAVRCDLNSEYGTRAHPQVLASYRTGAVRWSAAIGTGWRAPTFLDLYAPTTLWSAGNPSLEPEQSFSVDVGAEVTWGPATIVVNPFYRQASDLIRWSMDPVTYVFMPLNSDESRVFGAEFSAELVPLPALKFTARMLAADAQVRSGSSDAAWKQQAYAPRLSGTVGATMNLPASLNLSADMRWASVQYALDGGMGLELPAYALLNMRVSRRFGSGLEVFAQVRDALDQKGTNRAAMDFMTGEWTAYPQAGRSVDVGLRASFGL